MPVHSAGVVVAGVAILAAGIASCGGSAMTMYGPAPVPTVHEVDAKTAAPAVASPAVADAGASLK